MKELLGILVIISPLLLLFIIICKLEGTKVVIQTYILTMLIVAVICGTSYLGAVLLEIPV